MATPMADSLIKKVSYFPALRAEVIIQKKGCKYLVGPAGLSTLNSNSQKGKEVMKFLFWMIGMFVFLGNPVSDTMVFKWPAFGGWKRSGMELGDKNECLETIRNYLKQVGKTDEKVMERRCVFADPHHGEVALLWKEKQFWGIINFDDSILRSGYLKILEEISIR